MEVTTAFERGFVKDGEVVQKEDLPKFTLAKLRLASHPAANPQSLMNLSRHGWERIVASVAENPSTESVVLAKLASHKHPEVRIAVAENPNTPVVILEMMASDEDADVRYRLAENHNSPLSVLCRLCDDENPYVAERAIKTLSRLRHTYVSRTSEFPSFREKKKGAG